ncbi:hypothetical protein [Brevibacillus laterosporus]|uniref:hypothetical protein n=1 Tax=Brevibacillus laterosporus TaxID=1465 RepID=UPI003D21177E
MDELKIKVAKAEEKVEKCKTTIVRHEEQLAKKLAALAKKGIDTNDLEAFKYKPTGGGSEHYWDICDAQSKQKDVDSAIKKLNGAEKTLANWQAKLNAEIEAERFLEGNAPQVIKDFLEAWKQRAYEWHIKRYHDFQVLKEELRQKQEEAQLLYIKTSPDYATYLNDDMTLNFPLNLIISNPNKGMNRHLKELKLDYRSIKAKEEIFAGERALHMCTIYDEIERLEWLDKDLEEDKKAKMLDLVYRINAVVGTITDASGLRVNQKGNLDGIIVGDKGKAKIETIGAGGWNIQCFHFRTLIHKL